jgi:hypothetical protein
MGDEGPCGECGPKQYGICLLLIVTDIILAVFLSLNMGVLVHASQISDLSLEAIEQVKHDWGVQSYTSISVKSATVDEDEVKIPPRCA